MRHKGRFSRFFRNFPHNGCHPKSPRFTPSPRRRLHPRIHLSVHEKTLKIKHFCLIFNVLHPLFATRFERATFRLGGGRSIQLSYANITSLSAAVLAADTVELLYIIFSLRGTVSSSIIKRKHHVREAARQLP